MKVLELFSGIGGMHYAFRESGVCNYESCEFTSVDICPSANIVYKHNFPKARTYERTIETFQLDNAEERAVFSQADVLMMSPPCTPFTRLGKQRDAADRRCAGLSFIVRLLKSRTLRPRFILVENVREFAVSDARGCLIEALTTMGYCVREFVLTPTQFGTPNSRPRYYAVARLKEEASAACDSSEECPVQVLNCIDKPNNLALLPAPVRGEVSETVRSISSYLMQTADVQRYNVAINVYRYVIGMDIVRGDGQMSGCFTRGYTRMFKGGGSALVQFASGTAGGTEAEVADLLQCLEELDKIGYVTELTSDVRDRLRLRWFAPREVANLLDFPADFSWPAAHVNRDTEQDRSANGGAATPTVTDKQVYQLLGNSLNVKIVTILVRYLFSNSFFEPFMTS